MFSQMRWWLVWLLFAAGIINCMDRAAVSVAAPLIARDLHLDPAELGIAFSISSSPTRLSVSHGDTKSFRDRLRDGGFYKYWTTSWGRGVASWRNMPGRSVNRRPDW